MLMGRWVVVNGGMGVGQQLGEVRKGWGSVGGGEELKKTRWHVCG